MRVLQRFRRAHHGLAYFVAGVLVLMALVGVAASQILPLAERHPDRIAAWLGDRAGRPVHFERVRTQWSRRGPLLELDNLRIGSGADAVSIGDAELLISQYAGLLPGRSFTELRVRGLDLTLERSDTGRWQVRGLPGQQRPGADPFAALERLGELQVIGAKLRVLAPSLGIDAQIPRAHLRLRVAGDQVRAGVRTWMSVQGAPLDAVLAFDRKRGDGRAWIGAGRIELAQWSTLARVAGVQAAAGNGRFEAWLRLRNHGVSDVRADLALRKVQLRGVANPGEAAPQTALDRVQGNVRWTTGKDAWRLDAPLLEFGEGTSAARVRGLAIGGSGKRFAARADELDAAPLLAVAALSDALRPGIRHWLQTAKPAATLRTLEVTGLRNGTLRVSGGIAGAGFAAAGGAPGVNGLGGTFTGDRDGMVFRFDPDAAITLDWPTGFGVAHRLRLQGTIAGWREGAGWRTATTALVIRGSDYGADVRGGLWFQGDGTRPWIDLAADVHTAPVVAAKKFWIRHSMPAAAVRWLDTALQGGTVRGGRAVVSGDLDHWPFRANDGLFHATARIEQAKIKFQPDWPAAEQFNAGVDFIADGLQVHGQSASLAGVQVGAFAAGIEHFKQAELNIDAKAAADASKLLGLLRQSPLEKAYGETFANIEAAGPADVAFALKLPLHKGAPAPVMKGAVALKGARLREKRWDLTFDAVTGNATFDRGGFAAEKLAVVHGARPGKLSLRAGDGVGDTRHAFEAELDAQLRAEDLLQRAPDLGWLRSRVTGTSPWTIAVAVPKTSGNGSARVAGSVAAPSLLQLRSSLVGTALNLPAPLDKPVAASLPTTVDVQLPLGQGEVAVAFGNRLALRARSQGPRTGIRVVLGANRVGAPPPESGLVATGRSDRLDAIEWAALTRQPKASSRSPASGANGGSDTLVLRSVDVTVGGLELIGSRFPDTRLRATPASGGTSVRFDGPALAGALLLPNADATPIAGRIERLYWRSARPAVPAARAARTVPVVSTPGDDTDPARIPPLNLAVGDLRFGNARLGSATLQTQRVATGMRIVKLETRAPGQAIDVTGDWTGTGAAASTRLDARLQSADFGALLGGFGFGKQIADGKGSVRMQAAWPGSPASFRLAAMRGTLDVDMREGRLVEIEPGAGRVLGLLGIAQLPRRLMFDFRDLFDKGFAFDSIDGELQFGGGLARSQNLAIKGPAADIRIRGAADLRAQTYDQTIDVFPKTGNLLTVAGAIAGGPVGAAIGAAANAVLNKPIGQLSAKTYRVTGPWKEPKVETVGRGEAKAAAEAQTPPPG